MLMITLHSLQGLPPFKRYRILNKEVQVEDEKKAPTAEGAHAGQHKLQKKSKASKTVRVNPLSVTVADGAPSSAAEFVAEESPSAQVTLAEVIPAAVSLPKRLKGVVVPVTESEEKSVYKDVEDPEIETLFEGFEPSHYAGGASSPINTEKQGGSRA